MGAKIEAFDDSKKMALSDTNGLFNLKPVYRWHGAYLVGPIYLSLFPSLDMPLLPRTIVITAEGYQSITISTRILISDPKEDNVYVGKIFMARK